MAAWLSVGMINRADKPGHRDGKRLQATRKTHLVTGGSRAMAHMLSQALMKLVRHVSLLGI